MFLHSPLVAALLKTFHSLSDCYAKQKLFNDVGFMFELSWPLAPLAMLRFFLTFRVP